MGSADSFKPLSGRKVSPGNARSPSHLCLPHLHGSFPCKYWALMTMDILPRTNASYEVPVRQTSDLPKASFRLSLASLPLPSANTSPYRVYRGLSPPSNCAMPGAPQKSCPPGGRTAYSTNPETKPNCLLLFLSFYLLYLF